MVRKIPWRREWGPTPVFFGEFHGQKSLAGFSPWGHKESDTIEQLTHTHTHTPQKPVRIDVLYKQPVVRHFSQTIHS